MTVQLAPPLVFQAITPSGAPLSNGRLGTFAAGTNNPLATWIDATQTTQNTNPAILNSMGQLNGLWLDQNLAYKMVLQDAAGNQLYSVDNVFSGVRQVFPQTPAEIAAGVVPTNTGYPQGDVRRYGAVLDGATDCTAALVQATTVGGYITVPGNMALASASLALLSNKAVTLNSGTTIQGYAGFTTTVTGTTACNVFWSINQSSIEFYDFFCVGNGSFSGTVFTGYFWYIQCLASAVADMGYMCFDRGGLRNFAGLYWIYVDNTLSTGFAFVRFRADRSIFLSQSGNCQLPGPSSITTTAAMFGFSGSNTITGAYTVKDVQLINCFADGTFIKEFVFFWSGVLRAKASRNTLVGFGTDSSISNDTACYALSAYDFSHGVALAPNEIEFCNNMIDGARDCGIYVASATMLTVSGNEIQSVTGTGGTIPKGGISINSAGVMLISNNHVNSCQIGIGISQPSTPTGGRCDVLNNAVHAVPVNGAGMVISGGNNTTAQDININGIRIDTVTGSLTNGIFLNFTATVGCNNLNIENFDITGTANGIILFAPDSTVPAMGNVRIGSGRFRRITGNNIQWLNATNAATRATFESIDFMDLQAGAVVFFIASAVNVTVRALTFYDMTSGATFCWYGGSAQGRVEGVRFVNVAAANRYSGAANELGVITPIFTGADNDFVQDLNPNELIQVIAAANVKYTRQGWQWDRVTGPGWKEVRCLTGN